MKAGEATAAFEAFESALKCSECARLFEDPVILPCMHAFCRACTVDVSECPMCHFPFFPADRTPSPNIRSLLAQFVASSRRVEAYLTDTSNAGNPHASQAPSTPQARENWWRAFCEVTRKLDAAERLLREEPDLSTEAARTVLHGTLRQVGDWQPCDDRACALCDAALAGEPGGVRERLSHHPKPHCPHGPRAPAQQPARKGIEGALASAAHDTAEASRPAGPPAPSAPGAGEPTEHPCSNGAGAAPVSHPPSRPRAPLDATNPKQRARPQAREGGTGTGAGKRARAALPSDSLPLPPPPAHAPPPPAREIVLLPSSLSEDSAALVKQAAKALAGTAVVKAWSASVTHVITEPIDFGGKRLASRTYKHMCGILKGQWIVSSAWVRASLEHGRWLSEAPFELDGDMSTNGQRGPAKGRAAHAAGTSAIFAGLHVFLHGKFAHPNPARPQITELLSLGGAAVCATFAALQNEAVRARTAGCAVAMCDPDEFSAEFRHKCEQLRIPVVSPRWLMDSISHVARLDIASARSEYRLDGEAAPEAPVGRSSL